MSALTNTFTCGPRCDNINVPCIARRQRDCDGQEDPILSDIIPRGRGWCLDGRCYNRSSINQFNNRDPFTRRPFQFQAEEQQRRRRKITAEQREQYNARARERWAGMTAEERQEYNRMRRERREPMTAEERQQYNERARERRRNMTAEQREQYNRRRRERQRERREQERERRFRMLQERRMRD